MSIETWKHEFYRVEAYKVSVLSNMEMLRHSIKKWEGLQPENLARHELKATRGGDLYSLGDAHAASPLFNVSSTTCALCEGYKPGKFGCGSCPLSNVRGNVACDGTMKEERFSPFRIWIVRSNPMPMLQWLREALKAADKDGK